MLPRCHAAVTVLLSSCALGFCYSLAAQPAHPPGAPGSDAKQQLLAQLHDVINPQAVSWWPLSVGWWLLLLTVLAATLFTARWLYRRRQQTRYRRQALKMLEQIAQNNRRAANYAQQVAALLKRCFLAAYPQSRQLAATVHGDQWAQLLLKTQGKTAHSATIQWSEILYSRQHTEADTRPIEQFAKQWIKHHKPLSPGELNQLMAELHNEQARAKGAEHVSV